MKRLVTLIFSLIFLQGQSEFVYKTVLYQASPGKLTQLIDLIKSDIQNYKAFGIEKPVLMRHSQGAHWDLMLIIPIKSMAIYHTTENQVKRRKSKTLNQSYGSEIYNLIAHYEELFVNGPAYKQFKALTEEFPYYHIEMFMAEPGKQNELLKERQMENQYLINVDFLPNQIFTKISGSKWQIYTIGYYKDIKDFAKSVDIPFDKDDEAAKKAGFNGVKFIGTYLRELLREHQDTLAKRVD